MDFNTLQAACLSCQKCGLCQTRTHVVFGMGSPHAEVMFIGEGPGRNEDEQGLPFVGRSGQLLDKYLAAIHLKREDIFITNIVKCRPPENRDPTPQEWEACMPYLREQFRLIRPKIIVCLGRIAAQRLIRPDFSVMKEHGQKRAALCSLQRRIPQRCCATPARSPPPSAILLPCVKKYKRSARTHIIPDPQPVQSSHEKRFFIYNFLFQNIKENNLFKMYRGNFPLVAECDSRIGFSAVHLNICRLCSRAV